MLASPMHTYVKGKVPGVKRILAILGVFHSVRKEADNRSIMVSERHTPSLI